MPSRPCLTAPATERAGGRSAPQVNISRVLRRIREIGHPSSGFMDRLSTLCFGFDAEQPT